jgi:hypothetical protein
MQPMPEREAPNAPLWVKLFVVWHVLAITIWAIPHPTPAAMQKTRPPLGTEWLLYWNEIYLKGFQPISSYLFVTGAWQYWDMFSPNPSSKDLWLDAIVVYKDGSEKVYQYPRMARLSIPEKFVKERYRKFYERVDLVDNTFLWSVVAQRIAYLADDPRNPPTIVKLRRHWMFISPPGKPQPEEYSSYVYYWHAVDPKKLERDRKGP